MRTRSNLVLAPVIVATLALVPVLTALAATSSTRNGLAVPSAANMDYSASSVNAQVRVVPEAVEVPLGETVEVTVEVADAEEISSSDIALTFNPDVVEVVDADASQAGVQIAPGTFLDAGIVDLNAVDNDAGTLRFALTQLEPGLPKSGTGSLAVIQWRGKQVSDATPLTLTDAQLVKSDGSSLPASLVSGQISVVAGDPAPADTPTPTQEPGPLTPTSPPPSLPATEVPTIGGTPERPTVPPLATGLSATITPGPSNLQTTPGAQTQGTAASSATEPLPGSVGPSETPQPATAANIPAAVAAVAASATTPAATPAVVQASARVTEQSAPTAPIFNSPGSAVTLLALSAALGTVGIVAIWLVMRRRSQ